MKTVKLTNRSNKGFFYNETLNILKTATRGSFGYKYTTGLDGARIEDLPVQSGRGVRSSFSHSIAQMKSAGYELTTATKLIDNYGRDKEYQTDSMFLR